MSFPNYLASVLASDEHKKGIHKQVRASLTASIAGAVGIVVSIVLLVSGNLQPPADAFWLLCLTLGAGLFTVAQYTLVGALLSQFAAQRFASAKQDLEVYDLVAEQAAMRESLAALKEMMEARSKETYQADRSLLAKSLTVIQMTGLPDPSGDFGIMQAQVLKGWKERGVKQGLLDKISMLGSLTH